MDAADRRTYHTIGEVLGLLKPEFPDISISKIRFLESKGLIAPERTPSGYRKFSQADLDRLRFVLAEQRDKYLPLKVIRERADLWERGELHDEPTEIPVSREDISSTAPGSGQGTRQIRLDSAGLAEASGLAVERLRDLEDFGLIRADASAETPVYDETDLAIAKIARRFERYGIRARHLRMFRHATDRERDLFDQVAAPLSAHATPEAAEKAAKARSDLTVLARQLHEALLVQYLRERSG